MAKRTRIQNRIVRQLPREGAFNRCVGGGNYIIVPEIRLSLNVWP